MKILNCRIILLCIFFFLSCFLPAQQRSVDSIIALLKTSNDTAYIERCFQISDEYKNSRRIDLCFKYMDSSMQRAILIKSPRYEAFVYNNYGNTYNYLSDFPNALNNFEKAIRI